MGKDLKGKELGVGLYQRKDGRYEAKATIDGVKINLYDMSLSKLKILEFSQNYPPKINLLSFIIHNF